MILVIDVGTTGSARRARAPRRHHQPCRVPAVRPSTPFPGLVEFDASVMAELVLDAAHATLRSAGDPDVSAVGITNQRASSIVWERSTGTPVGPGLGWQDLRTVGECMIAKAEHGMGLAPNQSATKLGWMLANSASGVDPDLLCFGTVDTWVAWTLSQGALHVTDHSNAAVTGLFDFESGGWSDRHCDVLGLPASVLPTIVASSGVLGEATALPGAPPIASLVGDQQASLAGQGCVTPGRAKITFGTGGMLDVCTGTTPTGRRGTRATTGRSRSSRGTPATRPPGASRRSC